MPLAEAASHIFGYTIVNDVTASELLNADPNFPQWTRAKGSDTFGCVGPAIVSGFDWRSASVVTRLDGVERQNYPLSDIVFSPEEQVSLAVAGHDVDAGRRDRRRHLDRGRVDEGGFGGGGVDPRDRLAGQPCARLNEPVCEGGKLGSFPYLVA